MRSIHLLVNLAGNALSSLISAFTLVLAVGQLEVAAWGISAMLLGVGQFLGSVFSFGSQTLQLRELSQMSDNDFQFRAWRFGSSRLILGTAGILIGLLICLAFPAPGSVLVLAAGVFVSLGAATPLLSRRRYVAAAIVLLSEKCLAMALALWLLSLGMGEYSLPLSIGVAALPSALVSLILLRRPRRAGRSFGLRSARFALVWRGSAFFGLAAVAPSALLLDVGLVAMLSSPAEAAQYAVGSKLTAPLSVAATSIVQVFLPSLASLPIEQRKLKMSPRLFTVLVIVIFIALALFFGLPALIELILGDEYAPAIWPIRFFVLNAIIVLATRTLVTALQAWSRERLAAWLIAAQVAAALLGVALGASIQGAWLASAAVFASNVLLAVVLVFVVRRPPQALLRS